MPVPEATRDGRALPAIARAAIAARFGSHDPGPPAPDWLHEPGSCFVTLTQQGKLRGCIGRVQPRRSLLDDIRANAVAVAFAERRFPQLLPDELPITRIAVSVLSPLTSFDAPTEAEAVRLLRPGIDGVLLTHGWQRGVYLPQVWQTLPEPAQFLSSLKAKAGLDPDLWDGQVTFSRFTATTYAEDEPAGPPQTAQPAAPAP